MSRSTVSCNGHVRAERLTQNAIKKQTVNLSSLTKGGVDKILTMQAPN